MERHLATVLFCNDPACRWSHVRSKGDYCSIAPYRFFDEVRGRLRLWLARHIGGRAYARQ
eukprot:2914909-Pyramimonas_sp.AAC.1